MSPTLRSLSNPYTRVRTIVPRKEKDEPHRALGWMMTIDGKSISQHKVLFDKARLFASAIHGSRMIRQDAPIAYNCYFIASIGYTMAATKLSLNQCKSIQSPAVCATLNKMSIHRNVARALKTMAASKCTTSIHSKVQNASNTLWVTSRAMMETATS
jgi:hypothetical protein